MSRIRGSGHYAGETLKQKRSMAARMSSAVFVQRKRFVRWSRLGVFDRVFAGLAGAVGEPDRLMIDATHLKACR